MKYLSMKHLPRTKIGFTLAEIMVVLFVLTVILAAFAPMMTTRTKTGGTSPWRYASPDTANAYFGALDNQTAMIGQSTKSSDDIDSKLIINTPDDTAAILFKQDDTAVGQLFHAGNSLILGGSTEDIYDGDNFSTALGYYALATEMESSSSFSKDYSTAVGYRALSAQKQFSNATAIGARALSSVTTGGYDSVAIGYNALYKATTGGSNAVAIGSGALGTATTGGSNAVAIGSGALGTATTGGSNAVAIGYNAMNGASNPIYSTAIGYNAMGENTGIYSTAVGYNALAKSAGYSTAVGYLALDAAENSNAHNTAVGIFALGSVTSGTQNVGIGENAGGTIETGSYNLAVGNNACNGISSSSSNIACIGNYSGPNSSGSYYTKTLYLGNDNTTIYLGSTTLESYVQSIASSYSSDARLKNITGENNTGLEKIKQMKTYDYTLKSDKKSTPHTGVIAQEVQKFFPEAVVTGEDGYLKIRKDALFFAVVNAIKELASHDSDKDLKIQELEKKNAELEERLLKLEEKTETLSAKTKKKK